MEVSRIKSVLTDKVNWLLVGALALLASGATLNAGTTAFFTDTTTVGSNSFTTATVDLGATPFTALSFTKIVPGDVMWRAVNVLNSSNIRVPYYLTIKQDSGPAAYNGVDGLHMVAVRCFDAPAGGGVNVACNDPALESVQLISSLHAANTTYDITDLNDVAIVTSGTGSGSLDIGGTSVAGLRVQTADIGNCATGGAGACLMGGPTAANLVSNPAITSVTLYGAVTAGIPAGTSVVGLDPAEYDKTALLFFVPTTTTNAQLGAQAAASFTVAYTGVQPNGATTATNGSFSR